MMNETAVSLEALLKNALDGIFVIDRNRRYMLFNEACERITGYRQDEVLGVDCPCGQMVQCHDDYGRALSGFLCPARAIFDGRTNSARQRMQIRRKDGSAVWVETIYTVVRDQSGRVEFVLGVVRDASEAKAREESLIEELSTPAAKAETPATLRLDIVMAEIERQTIRRALAAANWQRNKAAELLGVSRSRLYRRMEALGVDPREHA